MVGGFEIPELASSPTLRRLRGIQHLPLPLVAAHCVAKFTSADPEPRPKEAVDLDV